MGKATTETRKRGKAAVPPPTMVEGFGDLGGLFDGLNARIDGVADAAVSAKAAADAAVAAGVTEAQLDAIIGRVRGEAPQQVLDALEGMKTEIAKGTKAASAAKTAGEAAKRAAGEARSEAKAAKAEATAAKAAAEEAKAQAKAATEAAQRARGLGSRGVGAYTSLAPRRTGLKVAYYAGTGIIIAVGTGELIGWWTGARWCRFSSFFTEAPLL